MDNLLLHSATRSQLEGFLSRPAGTLLLVGPAGSGKTAVANQLISELLGVDSGKLTGYPYFLNIRKPEDKSEIPIDDIREVIRKLKLKVPTQSYRDVSRAVLIEDAHNLSGEAQNALLKLLEEPPAATVFVLSVTTEDSILPTVVSRAQRISILAPTLEQSLEFYKHYPKQQIEADWWLSRGAAGLQSALLNEAEHPLKSAIAEAKRFLSQDQYHRLLALKQLGNKQEFGLFLDALGRVMAALQAESIKRGSRSQKRLLAARKTLDKAIAYHQTNVNNRLICLMLAADLTL
jgi:SpoVK/Ycf46/Vps4 family AAA+-type ATPase